MACRVNSDTCMTAKRRFHADVACVRRSAQERCRGAGVTGAAGRCGRLTRVFGDTDSVALAQELRAGFPESARCLVLPRIGVGKCDEVEARCAGKQLDQRQARHCGNQGRRRSFK